MPKVIDGILWYKASEIAKMLSVDLKTVHNWCNASPACRAAKKLNGDYIKHERSVGGHLRIEATELAQWLERHKQRIPLELQQNIAALKKDAPEIGG